eukprot:g11822.t1
MWHVVGGQKSGGLLVRSGSSLTSPAYEKRLQAGALLRELALGSNRLHYELLEGEGPPRGWVTLRLHGLELVTRQVVANVFFLFLKDEILCRSHQKWFDWGKQ